MKKKQTVTPLELSSTEVLLGWLYLGIEFLVLPTAIHALGAVFGGFSAATANILYYIINALACGLIFRRPLGISLANAGQDVKRFLNAVIMGFLAYYVASFLLAMGITLLLPDFSNVNDEAVASLLSQQPVIMTLCVVALVPLAEECLFRGLLFVPFARKAPWLGYAISCLGFAAIHVVGYLGTSDAITLAVCFIQYLPAGACLAWACRKSDSLFAPILIHAAINGLSVILVR